MPVAGTIVVGAKIFDERETHSLETAPQFIGLHPISRRLSSFRNRCQNSLTTFECSWICEDRNGAGAKGLRCSALATGQLDEAKPFKQRLNIGSRVTREGHARLCVQVRLACSAGDSPAGVEVRAP